MKTLIISLSLLAFTNSAYAAETIGEKASAKTHDVKRKVKKVVHRGEEKVCEKTDKNCFAKKTRNRANEVKDYAKDKTTEGANVIDGDMN